MKHLLIDVQKLEGAKTIKLHQLEQASCILHSIEG